MCLAKIPLAKYSGALAWSLHISRRGHYNIRPFGVANKRSVEAKESAYDGILGTHRKVRLRPLVIETFGALSEDFQCFIRDAARNQTYHRSLPHDALPRLIYSMAQRISVTFIHTDAHVHQSHLRASFKSSTCDVSRRYIKTSCVVLSYGWPSWLKDGIVMFISISMSIIISDTNVVQWY